MGKLPIIKITGSSGIGKTTMAKLYKKKYPDTLILDDNTECSQYIMKKFLKDKPNGRIIIITE